MNENQGKKIIEEQTNMAKPSSSKSSNEMRKKLLKLLLVIGGLLIVLLLVMFILSLFKTKSMSYEQIENEMKKAAINYYQVQTSLLPEEGNSVEVDATILADSGYMKPLKELKNEECQGKVVVQNIAGDYVYTPYLTCGNSYVSKDLFEELMDKNIVTSGDGLYSMNGEYVFRGEYVNNYVKLDHYVFRIVKITSDHKIMITPQYEKGGTGYSFDDRYNAERGYNSGINDFRISRMADYLIAIYNDTSSGALLSEKDKTKLTSFSLCIGKRTLTTNNNTNSVECSDIEENQMIGLMTASDYLNASLDHNCQMTSDKACQNYNYLKTDYDWWLITANAEDTYRIMYVNSTGYIQMVNAINNKKIRPVLMLNEHAMIASGRGTVDNPYILK